MRLLTFNENEHIINPNFIIMKKSLLFLASAALFSATAFASGSVQDYTVTPTANAKGTVGTISPIVLTFTNATKVEDNPSANYYTQYAYVEYQSPRGGWGDVEIEPTIEGNTITFTILDDVNDGTYTLTVPAGTYLLDGTENEDITVNLTYANPYAYTVLPIDNASISEIMPIVVTFTNAEEVKENPKADWGTQYARVEYYIPKTNTYEDTEYEVAVEDNVITLTLSGNLNDGTYVVTIPAGTYLVDGKENPEIVSTFTYANPLSYTTSPIANAYATSISPITVTFTNAEEVTENEAADNWTSVEYYNSRRGVWIESVIDELNLEGNTISIELDAHDQIPGKFRVTIPAGTYLVDGKENPEIIFTFDYNQVIDVTVSSVGYATFFSEYTTAIPLGVEAYVGALSADNTTLTLTAISEYIPAYTAVVLKAEEGDYKFATTTETVEAIEVNDLQGTYSESSTKDVEGQVYILSHTDGENVGFYKYEGETLAANKAYLVLPANSAAPVVRFNFGEGTDNVSGIESIEAENAGVARIFDLQGRSLRQAPQKGMYILNGRKVIR
jgi:hypothetical protein